MSDKGFFLSLSSNLFCLSFAHSLCLCSIAACLLPWAQQWVANQGPCKGNQVLPPRLPRSELPGTATVTGCRRRWEEWAEDRTDRNVHATWSLCAVTASANGGHWAHSLLSHSAKGPYEAFGGVNWGPRYVTKATASQGAHRKILLSGSALCQFPN